MQRAILHCILVVTLSACGSTTLQLNREHDPDEADVSSPDAYVERFGEPDEWRRDGEGDKLRMTAIWRCLDGEYREVVWRRQAAEARARELWVVIQDSTREGECD
jgi:hypothetical protein